jgi:signal transduction histidine kinase
MLPFFFILKKEGFMYTNPLNILTGDNLILKNVLDESRFEIYLVHPETLEIFYMNRRAGEKTGLLMSGTALQLSSLGKDYQPRSFRGLITPLLEKRTGELILLTHHQGGKGKSYPVEVRILLNVIQDLTYLVITAQDISEKLQLEKELKFKNEELKKLGFELDKFVHSASHDLLAPVSTLKGLLSLLEKDHGNTEDPDCLKMMSRTIQKLERYIHDMIDFSKNMRLDVSGDPINFKSLVSVSLENIKRLDGFEKLHINIDISQEQEFHGDESRILMLFDNLLSNAIKYQDPAAPKPFIDIQIQADHQKVVIRISDNGIGIGNECIDRVFNMFYRATAISDGSGLGLYLVREVVKKLKGNIQLASTVGKGTEFLLEIPNKINRASVQKHVNDVKPFKTAL